MASFLPYVFKDRAISLAARPACNGPSTSIASVRTYAPSTDVNGVNIYRIGVTIENLGKGNQADNALDSVVMYQQGEKTDEKGLKPLAAGDSQTVFFTYQRSGGPRRGTTNLRFRIAVTQPGTNERRCECATRS
jgi:hypothetical protein